MFNYTGWYAGSFSSNKVLNGLSRLDSDSFRTLSCGPDPADPNRVLIRKIIQINETTYAYEETRISRDQTVHTTLTKIAGFDMNEKLHVSEIALRNSHRAMPNVIGFSLYFRKGA